MKVATPNRSGPLRQPNESERQLPGDEQSHCESYSCGYPKNDDSSAVRQARDLVEIDTRSINPHFFIVLKTWEILFKHFLCERFSANSKLGYRLRLIDAQVVVVNAPRCAKFRVSRRKRINTCVIVRTGEILQFCNLMVNSFELPMELSHISKTYSGSGEVRTQFAE